MATLRSSKIEAALRLAKTLNISEIPKLAAMIDGFLEEVELFPSYRPPVELPTMSAGSKVPEGLIQREFQDVVNYQPPPSLLILPTDQDVEHAQRSRIDTSLQNSVRAEDLQGDLRGDMLFGSTEAVKTANWTLATLQAEVERVMPATMTFTARGTDKEIHLTRFFRTQPGDGSKDILAKVKVGYGNANFFDGPMETFTDAMTAEEVQDPRKFTELKAAYEFMFGPKKVQSLHLHVEGRMTPRNSMKDPDGNMV